MGELERLRVELQCLQAPNGQNGRTKQNGRDSRSTEEGLSLEAFTEVVQRTVPEFPPDLCGRLFRKLDVFGVGKLAFAELACGMSALSLGTMDEKLQVCFDLFDSEGQRALTLKDLCDLCTVLFRVALAQGFAAARTPNTDEVLLLLQQPLRTHANSDTALTVRTSSGGGLHTHLSQGSLVRRALSLSDAPADLDHTSLEMGSRTPPA